MTAGKGWVLVTGASRGIGQAVAWSLAAAGHDLVLWARTGDALERTAADARELGIEVRTAVVDVASAGEVAAAAESSLDRERGLAGLVINAGQGTWAALTELDPASWDRTLRTNLDGAYHTLRVALPLLTATPGSLIVGLSSDSALHPFSGRAAYSASKAGLQAMLEVVRREVRASGVRVSVVVPSRVDTFFAGGHRDAAPGTRKGALSGGQVAEVVSALFALPPVVEVRQLQLAAMTSTFGLQAERTQP